MLDPKLIRNQLHEIAEQLLVKNYTLDVASLQEIEEDRKRVQIETESLQAERNSRSKMIGKAKAAGEDIQPLLESRCVSCHGADKRKGGLRLHTRELAFGGGSDWGLGVVPHKPEESSLYLQISISPDDDPDDLLMPPTKKGGPLTADAIASVQRWIAEGAEWPSGVTLSERLSDELSSIRSTVGNRCVV